MKNFLILIAFLILSTIFGYRAVKWLNDYDMGMDKNRDDLHSF